MYKMRFLFKQKIAKLICKLMFYLFSHRVKTYSNYPEPYEKWVVLGRTCFSWCEINDQYSIRRKWLW